ncbi:hypothetical protein SB394_02985 [Burkholderia sp. BCCIQ04A]|uniref:Short-chain dehydrogenase n=1 Tax=Burkholderia anthinoferrum TaxID=3090833 RepID=A0ABU5WUA3_9BURK|nr:hypothetical protein [Burkholderia anthinoferrum]MEB2535932.1 hypothetical protein [Burkholderia anthinoferrum]MEB2562060.1 hypothetical protein [Burkholderia anthinoferrum]MEB2582360.1 hypothetical protein [Burkholderia anthinoferrum]MEB2632686.1 hypothetical protein [Burkholderia anthinoferrum]
MNLTEARSKISEWLVEAPLYETLFEYEEKSAVSAIYALTTTDAPFDMYCPGCRAHSTYTPIPSDEARRRGLAAEIATREGMKNPMVEVEDFQIEARCARSFGHTARFIFLHIRGESVQKIGQFPSLADLSIPDTSQFEKALGQDRVRELNKAIGLAAHGVGVGSYIYLRRVFESLVEEAHKLAQSGTSWDEEKYRQSRMLEKIELVASHLPKFLVENPQLYGILSKHIHELSEKDCLANFELMKEAVLIIARDKKSALDEAAHRERTTKLIGKVNSAIAGKID